MRRVIQHDTTLSAIRIDERWKRPRKKLSLYLLCLSRSPLFRILATLFGPSGKPSGPPAHGCASSRSRSAMKASILDDTSSRCACNCSRAPTSKPLSVISASIDRIEASSLNIPLSIFLIRRLRAAPPPLRAGPALVLNPRPSFPAAQPTNGTSRCRPGAHTVREHRSQPCALAAHPRPPFFPEHPT